MRNSCGFLMHTRMCGPHRGGHWDSPRPAFKPGGCQRPTACAQSCPGWSSQLRLSPRSPSGQLGDTPADNVLSQDLSACDSYRWLIMGNPSFLQCLRGMWAQKFSSSACVMPSEHHASVAEMGNCLDCLWDVESPYARRCCKMRSMVTHARKRWVSCLHCAVSNARRSAISA